MTNTRESGRGTLSGPRTLNSGKYKRFFKLAGTSKQLQQHEVRPLWSLIYTCYRCNTNVVGCVATAALVVGSMHRRARITCRPEASLCLPFTRWSAPSSHGSFTGKCVGSPRAIGSEGVVQKPILLESPSFRLTDSRISNDSDRVKQSITPPVFTRKTGQRCWVPRSCHEDRCSRIALPSCQHSLVFGRFNTHAGEPRREPTQNTTQQRIGNPRNGFSISVVQGRRRQPTAVERIAIISTGDCQNLPLRTIGIMTEKKDKRVVRNIRSVPSKIIHL